MMLSAPRRISTRDHLVEPADVPESVDAEDSVYDAVARVEADNARAAKSLGRSVSAAHPKQKPAEALRALLVDRGWREDDSESCPLAFVRNEWTRAMPKNEDGGRRTRVVVLLALLGYEIVRKRVRTAAGCHVNMAMVEGLSAPPGKTTSDRIAALDAMPKDVRRVGDWGGRTRA